MRSWGRSCVVLGIGFLIGAAFSVGAGAIGPKWMLLGLAPVLAGLLIEALTVRKP